MDTKQNASKRVFDATKFLSFNFLRANLARFSAGVSRLLAVLVTLSSSAGEVRATAAVLGEACGVSRRQIFRLLRVLRASGLVVVVPNYQGPWRLSNTYKLNSKPSEDVSSWADVVLQEFGIQRARVYGFSAATEDQSSLRRSLVRYSGAFHELLANCEINAAAAGSHLARAFLKEKGRDNFLIEKAHPVRCFIEDFELLLGKVGHLILSRKQEAKNSAEGALSRAEVAALARQFSKTL